MPHRRTEIRDAFAAELESAPEILALAQVPAIEKARQAPLDEPALPMILVYFGNETPQDELESKSPRVYLLEAEVVVEYVSSFRVLDSDFETAADLAAEAIEPALERLETTRVGGLVKQARYAGTEIVGELRGSRHLYSLRIRTKIEYQRAIAPATPDDFTNVGTEYDVGDAQPDNPTDSTDLPQ